MESEAFNDMNKHFKEIINLEIKKKEALKDDLKRCEKHRDKLCEITHILELEIQFLQVKLKKYKRFYDDRVRTLEKLIDLLTEAFNKNNFAALFEALTYLKELRDWSK